MDMIVELNKLIEMIKIKNKLLEIKLEFLNFLPENEEDFFNDYILKYFKIVNEYIKKIEQVEFNSFLDYVNLETFIILKFPDNATERSLKECLNILKGQNIELNNKIYYLQNQKEYFSKLYLNIDNCEIKDEIIKKVINMLELMCKYQFPNYETYIFVVEYGNPLIELLESLNQIDINEKRIDDSAVRKFNVQEDVKKLSTPIEESLVKLYIILENHKDVILENIKNSPFPIKWVCVNNGNEQSINKPISFYHKNLFYILGSDDIKEGILEGIISYPKGMEEKVVYNIYIDSEFNFYKGFLCESFSTSKCTCVDDKMLYDRLGEIYEEIITPISPNELLNMYDYTFTEKEEIKLLCEDNLKSLEIGLKQLEHEQINELLFESKNKILKKQININYDEIPF